MCIKWTDSNVNDELFQNLFVCCTTLYITWPKPSVMSVYCTVSKKSKHILELSSPCEIPPF